METPIVVLGYSAAPSPLPGAWPTTHRALLPVCGKPIVVHQLEHLARAGYRHVRLGRCASQAALRRRLGDGREWGVTLRYSDLPAQELCQETLIVSGGCLTTQADALLTGPLPAADSLEPKYWEADTPLPGNSCIHHLHDDGDVATLPVGAPVDCATPLDYHELNLGVLRGNVDCVVPGRPMHGFNAIADWKTRVSDRAFVGRDVFLGKHVLIDADARLEGECILSNGVVVGSGVRLRNVTVLPNTHVLPDSRFENAVLGPNGMFSLAAPAGPAPRLEPSDALAESRDAQVTTGLPRSLRQARPAGNSFAKIFPCPREIQVSTASRGD